MSSTVLAKFIKGSIISTSKEVKKISYLSWVEDARSVAPVSSFGITVWLGLGMVNRSTSHPKVLVLFGLRVVTMEPSLVMLLLKKLLDGLTVLDNVVKEPLLLALMANWSPVIRLSPSKAATPNLAFTGNGAGNVVNPLKGISTVCPDLIPAYPSKVVIYLPGNVGFSYTTTKDQPPEIPPVMLLPELARTLATKYSPSGLGSAVNKEVTSL